MRQSTASARRGTFHCDRLHTPHTSNFRAILVFRVVWSEDVWQGPIMTLSLLVSTTLSRHARRMELRGQSGMPPHPTSCVAAPVRDDLPLFIRQIASLLAHFLPPLVAFCTVQLGWR